MPPTIAIEDVTFVVNSSPEQTPDYREIIMANKKNAKGKSKKKVKVYIPLVYLIICMY
jgi:hypothetical protein